MESAGNDDYAFCINESTCGNPTCGDGAIDSPEECDDSGAVEGDGCSELCFVEEGWWCAGEPSACEPDIYDIVATPYAYAYDVAFSTHEADNCHVHSGTTSPPQDYVNVDVGETATVAHSAVVYPLAFGVPLEPSTLYYYDVHCGDDESGVKTVTTSAPGPDNRAAPTATLVAPLEGIVWPDPHVPLGFLAYVDIDRFGFPDAAVTFDIEVYDDEETPGLYWSSSGAASNTYYRHDGVQYIAILRGVTHSLIESEHYSMRVRARAAGFPVSEWTAMRHFSVSGTPLDELLAKNQWCVAPSGWVEKIICASDSFYNFLFTPSQGSRNFLNGAMSGWADDEGVLPFASLIGVTVSEVPYCPLPTFVGSKFGYAGVLIMPTFDLCDKVEEAAGDLNEIPAVGVGFEVMVAIFGLACVVGLIKFAFGQD